MRSPLCRSQLQSAHPKTSDVQQKLPLPTHGKPHIVMLLIIPRPAARRSAWVCYPWLLKSTQAWDMLTSACRHISSSLPIWVSIVWTLSKCQNVWRLHFSLECDCSYRQTCIVFSCLYLQRCTVANSNDVLPWRDSDGCTMRTELMFGDTLQNRMLAFVQLILEQSRIACVKVFAYHCSWVGCFTGPRVPEGGTNRVQL
jgi:hypothetical protein